MKARHLIFVFSLIVFTPATLLLLAGLALIPAAVFGDLAKGHIIAAVLLLPLLGAIWGLSSAVLVTFDIAGASFSRIGMNKKRWGLIAGFASELSVIAAFTPNMEPFVYYWLPPLVGGVVLLALSFRSGANNKLQPTASGVG